ncbi:MAG: hypothetical protein FD126_1919 [Elusimicrobia bacterium]|nr:MAG: hypothetical protein FD126_1919 [Elusimicrobiota bacterium]
MTRFAVLLALLAAPAAALDSAPLQQTAGSKLRDVWAQARGKYPDAKLLSITGATGSDGRVRCSPTAPFQSGWRLTFYSPAVDEFVMMAECGGVIAGPLRQLRSRGADAAKLTVSGKFIDSDMALKTLGKAGIDLAAIEAKTPGKRAFSLSLARLDDTRFKAHPPVWRVTSGADSWVVDAVHNEKFNPERYGLDFTVQLASAIANSETLAARPKKGDVYSAKTDLEKVLSYARDHFPEANLMAVEGLVDAWGASMCIGPGDGWAYYFYNPRRRDFEVLFSCKGFVGPGPARNIPVDLARHEPLAGPYVDSDTVIDAVLVTHGDAFNETMGSRFTRKATALLRQYKTAPFNDPALWKVRMLWELTIGRTVFRFDAVNGRLLDVR